MIEGGCRCGAVRYAIAVDALPPVYCCHCTDCQTWSGSAFTEQAVVRPEAIAVSGTVVEFSLTAPSGAISTQYVCEICGTRLWNTNSKRLGLAALRAGTLDASPTIMPRAHIWTTSKQGWIAIPEGIPTWPGNAPVAGLAAALQKEA